MRKLLLSGFAAIVLFATGCGSDDSGSTESQATTTAAGTRSTGEDLKRTIETIRRPADDDALIRLAIAHAFGTDPEQACVDAVTPGYVATAFGDEQGCREAVRAGANGKGDPAVEAPVVDGDSATAVIHPRGGATAGEKVTLTLVKQDGAWKVDTARADVPVGP